MDLWHDVRFAVRSLSRQRSLAAAVITTLAVGIGATTAVFTVADGILRHPLPYRDAERIVHLVGHGIDPSGRPERTSVITLPYLRALRERATTVTSIGGYDSFSRVTRQRLAATVASDNGAVRLLGTRLSPVLFSTFGVGPVLGRAFDPAEERPGQNAVVIVSHRTWRTVFGSDGNVLGKPFTVDGRIYSIVGVMPADFSFPDSQTDFWIPLTPREIPPSEPLSDSPESYYADAVYARLADGVSLQAADNEIDAIIRAVDLEMVSRRPPQLHEQYRRRAALPRRAEAVRMQDELVAPARPALLLLSLAVAFVLLIACANVVNIMLARGVSRRGEMALKAALGASASRLFREVVTETVLLALAGGALGLALAFWTIHTGVRLAPSGIPRVEEIGISTTVLLYALAVSFATGIVLGTLPAARVLRADASQGLTTPPTERRLFSGRDVVVAGEVALTTVLLISAGLLIRSFVSLAGVDPGYDARGVLTFQVVMPPDYGGDQQRVFGDLLERLETLPRVAATGATDVLPIAGSSAFRLSLPGLPVPAGPGDSMVMRVVSGRYFAAMGIPLVEGRALSGDDVGRRPEPMVVNREFVRRYFGGASGVGRVVGRDPVFYEVVGVVENVRHAGLHADAEPEYYVELRNTALAGTIRPYFVVRTADDPASLLAAIRTVVRQVDPRLGVDLNLKAMADIVSDSVARPRFQTALLSAFAVIALVLAAMGVYGVTAYSVEQRTREIGIRVALGAVPGDVMRLVLAQGARITVTGVGFGLAGAAGMTRSLEAMLFGLTPLDPLTFVIAPATLGAIATIASYLPARRATKVNPIAALRAN